MLRRNGEELKSLLLYFDGKVRYEVGGLGQSSRPKLNREFPCGGSADKDRIVCSRNRFSSRRGKSRMVKNPPKQSVGIEEHAQLYYSHSASSLSDIGSKNSGPRTNLPFHEPGWRFPFTGPTGTSRATGFEPRAIMISSPSAARAINLERLVLAW